MTLIVRTIPLLALVLLSACFMSQTPRIETGTLLAEGPVIFCPSDEDDCQTGEIEGDGYRVPSDNPDEEDVRLRFEPLVEANGVQIYLGEAELRDEDTSTWTYLVARPAAGAPDGLPRFEIMMPGCNDLDSSVREQYGIVRADSYTCTVDDLGAFRTYLTDNYLDKFANSDWWDEVN